MIDQDDERIKRAALAVAALIKLLVHKVSTGSIHWSRPYLVGFTTTLIGLCLRINASPLSDDELPEALAIAWTEITGTPWKDELLIRDEEFAEGANIASKLVRLMDFEEKPREAADLLREVFASRFVN